MDADSAHGIEPLLDFIESQEGRTKMCSCGKTSGNSAESYVVRTANGQTKEFASKVAADIEVSKSGGSYTVKKK